MPHRPPGGRRWGNGIVGNREAFSVVGGEVAVAVAGVGGPSGAETMRLARGDDRVRHRVIGLENPGLDGLISTMRLLGC